MNQDNFSTPTAFVIFGATGDLTSRKLVPALYELKAAGRLPNPFYLIGYARRDWDDRVLREKMSEAIHEFARSQPIEPKALENLLGSIRYLQAPFEDAEGYRRLGRMLDELGAVNRLYYLASPPDVYATIIQGLGEAGLARGTDGWARIVIEKPYGEDLKSAQELDAIVHRVFEEKQVYRIDHYLGKETVQNILVFRFANGIFEPLWNNRNVDHVQSGDGRSGRPGGILRKGGCDSRYLSKSHHPIVDADGHGSAGGFSCGCCAR